MCQVVEQHACLHTALNCYSLLIFIHLYGQLLCKYSFPEPGFFWERIPAHNMRNRFCMFSVGGLVALQLLAIVAGT